MLYSESMEGPTPLVALEKKSKVAQWLSDQVAQPRLDVGICLGGGQTRVASHRRSARFPSCLALNERGKVVALGDEAGALEGREPEGVRIVRPVQGGVLYDLDGGRRLLEAALRCVRFSRGTAPQLVLAISANPSPLEKDAWMTLAREAGAREVFLTSQVLAAAAGAGLDVLAPRARMVVHVGAGQCEVAVIAMGHCLFAKNLRLGGENLTIALREHIRCAHQFLIDRSDAEKLKHSLSLDSKDESAVTATGRQLDTGQPVTKDISRKELADVVRPQVAEWCQFLHQFLAEIPIEWVEDIQRDGMMLTGGAAQLQGFQTMLRERTGLLIRMAEQPEEVCSLGLRRMLGDGAMRRALFAPRPLPAVHADFRVLPKHQGRLEWAWGSACALLGLSFLISVQAGQALAQGDPPPAPLAGIVVPGLAALSDLPQAPTSSKAQEMLQSESQRQLQQLSAENKRLWKWLAKRETSAQKEILKAQPVLARVAARDPRGWLSRWMLDVGTEQGVKVGQVVVADGGLLGRVVQAGPESCMVRLFLDGESVLGAGIPARKASGVLMGHATPNLEMRYVDPDAGVQVGDKVVTNGQDSQLPAGIPLGRVSSMQRQLDSSFLTLVVTPTVKLDEVREVMILRGRH